MLYTEIVQRRRDCCILTLFNGDPPPKKKIKKEVFSHFSCEFFNFLVLLRDKAGYKWPLKAQKGLRDFAVWDFCSCCETKTRVYEQKKILTGFALDEFDLYGNCANRDRMHPLQR